MPSEKRPRLHRGSRWEGERVIDPQSTSVEIDLWQGNHFLEVNDNNDGHNCSVWIADALAVIRRANLDPVAIAAEALLNKFDDREAYVIGGPRFIAAEAEALRAALDGSDG
jgi:hypothetical protein